MKILITGALGQLGTDCRQVLQKEHEVTGIDIDDLDIGVLAEVRRALKQMRPDIVLNCAAYTLVDKCETERELAWSANVQGPENLARSVEELGGRLIHISTDYIFDGRKPLPEPYVESDEPHPLSYYGLTKLESETAVRRMTDRHIIVRTAWVYGVTGRNFLKTMLKMALKNPQGTIKVVNDQFGSPTWSYRLAGQISQMIDKNCLGTYHVTAEGFCSWYELASYFLAQMGVVHTVVPCASQEYPLPAERPKNSILENQRLKKEHINLMKPWAADIDEFIARFKDRLLAEVAAAS